MSQPQFLYSPALLKVLPSQAARTVLAKCLCDTSPEVRVYSLQALGNILFHPEKVRTSRHDGYRNWGRKARWVGSWLCSFRLYPFRTVTSDNLPSSVDRNRL